MRRRALLATLASATTAGCANFGSNPTATTRTSGRHASRAGTGTSASGETTPSNATSTTDDDATTGGDPPSDDARVVDDWSSDADPTRVVAASPDADVAFPDAVADWRLSLWNDADSARTFQVAAETPDGRVLDVTLAVDADAWVLARLPQVEPYDVRVTVAGEEAWSRSVDAGDYTCSAWDTNVAVRDGSADVLLDDHRAVGCPRVGGFETLDASTTCVANPAHDAQIRFRDGAVELSGRVATPDACYAMFHDGPVYDFGARTLRVGVVSSPHQTADCASCSAEHAYELSVPVADAYPKRVVVDHTVATGDGLQVTVVARETRPSDA